VASSLVVWLEPVTPDERTGVYDAVASLSTPRTGSGVVTDRCVWVSFETGDAQQTREEIRAALDKARFPHVYILTPR
jgi:hypothetical protein